MASSLREAEFVLAVLQNDKRVALVHVLVGLEADFASVEYYRTAPRLYQGSKTAAKIQNFLH